MEYRKFGEKIYVRLDKGDEILTSLLTLCETENLSVAQIQGIGGCDSVTVGIFDPVKKEYNQTTVEGMLEMISLDGNLTIYEEKPYLHAHATFAYEQDGKPMVLAGHLLKAEIGLTGEIVITPADGHISRKYIEELGIRVWDFN